MSTQVESVTFMKMRDPNRGMCQEVRTYDRPHHTLAYVTSYEVADYGYELTLFGVGHTYFRRVLRKTRKGAQGVLDRHLSSEGYDLVEIAPWKEVN